MNPYRQVFYANQAEWHGTKDLSTLQKEHENRSLYYKWYTKDWLPKQRTVPCLDIGCGAGQFVYFLNKEGYTEAKGIDIDEQQVQLAQGLGLNCKVASVENELKKGFKQFELISMLDILEHFTMEELFPLMESVCKSLAPGGRLIVSVPNATSPSGLSTRYSDITHETAFSPGSLSQLFFCHGMKVIAFRDPWPAPISFSRKILRSISLLGRKCEAVRLKAVGLSVPEYWSSVIWAVAEKQL
jgi:SAM-dependent methyltransferase